MVIYLMDCQIGQEECLMIETTLGEFRDFMKETDSFPGNALLECSLEFPEYVEGLHPKDLPNRAKAILTGGMVIFKDSNGIDKILSLEQEFLKWQKENSSDD